MTRQRNRRADLDRAARNQRIRIRYRALQRQLAGLNPDPRMLRTAQHVARGILAVEHTLSVDRIRQIVATLR